MKKACVLFAVLLAVALWITGAAAEPEQQPGTAVCPHEQWQITRETAPSCTQEGEREQTCLACGETITETVPALGHDFVTETAEATCTEEGKTETTCTRCGETQTEIIPALGHDFTEKIKPATCQEAGRRITTCSRCGATETEAIPPLGHAFTTETTPATCTEDGKTVSVCDRCGAVVTERLPATGHEFETKTTDATCTEEGKTETVCTRCGETQTETTPALGHNYASKTTPATCTAEGETVFVCARCGNTVRKGIPATGHRYGDWQTEQPATWRAAGSRFRVCAVCGDRNTGTTDQLTHLPESACPAGDADMDGDITAADSRLILRLSVGFDDGLDADQHKKADYDGVEGVTSADARWVLRLSVNLSAYEPEQPKAPQLEDGYVWKGKTEQGYDLAQKDGVTYVVTPYGYILIANKTYSLPAAYGPGDLTAVCAAAFREMQRAAWADGIDLYVVSGYRSYSTQKRIYNNYCAMDGREMADTYSARPGHSEHQSGLAMDLNSLSASFAYTAEGRWLAAHAHEYGFVIRYQKEKQTITGYVYEPWHVRYLGKELAAAVYESGLCLEEYFGITSTYD